MSKKSRQPTRAHPSAWSGPTFQPEQVFVAPDELGAPGTAQIAVVLHLFYIDTWDEFAEYLARIPEPFDLFVSLASLEDLNEVAPHIRARHTKARLFVHPNRGRDLGPFMSLTNLSVLDSYDAVCKLHSKSSRYSDHGSRWRHDILERVLPSRDAVAGILSSLRAPKGPGVIGPDAYILTEGRYWKGNAERINKLCAALAIPETLRQVEFFAGTMFWYRPAAFSGLAKLGLRLDHFEPEAGQRNETLAHVIERVFTLLARARGFAIADTREPDRSIPFRGYDKAKAHILDEMLESEAAPPAVYKVAQQPARPSPSTTNSESHRLLLLLDGSAVAYAHTICPLLQRISLETHVIIVSPEPLPTSLLQTLQQVVKSVNISAHSAQEPVLHALAPLLDTLSPAPGDTFIRLNLSFDATDQIRRRAFSGFAESFLEPAAVRGMVDAFARDSGIGMILPAAAPSMTLWAAEDGNFVEDLSRRLGISLEAFENASYYPDAIYCLPGSLLSDLHERYLRNAHAGDPALALAVEIGLAAVIKDLGRQVIEIRTTRKVEAGSQDVGPYVQQILQGSSEESRAQEFRHRTYQGNRPASPVKVIAYFLPQFHPIPENDAWWGKGFTEWHNVSRAVPRFVGHYQPHLPGELGFYDLRLQEVMHQQVELARSHGIHGFCFYYYWFNGKRLLETPIENYHADPSLDLPYCLCWANENWTRRWDGQDQEILIEQAHSARDDLRFIHAIAHHLADPRYIRVDGKPLLLVYRANQLADARATAERWRNFCRQQGIGEIHLAAVMSFGITDPRPFGFDAAVEFPPHGLNQPPITTKLDMIDPHFAGIVYDYRDAVLYAAATKYTASTAAPYPIYGGCMLAWDNDARRRGKGHIFHHALPQAYANWLRIAAAHGLRQSHHDNALVFVNAWNEWAEGTHLEPDRRYGHAYLTATADTIALFSPHQGLVRDDAPADLGIASPVLRGLPSHLFPRRGPVELALFRDRFARLGQSPRLRVVLPFPELSFAVFETVHSLAEQTYTQFALSVVSSDQFAREWAAPIVTEHVRNSEPHQGINQVANQSSEDWLIFVSPGDYLLPHTLLVLAAAAAAAPDAQMLYSDECNGDGYHQPIRPVLKPNFDPVRLTYQSYLGGLIAIRCDAFEANDGLRTADIAGSLHELALRISSEQGTKAIHHVPEILLWRPVAHSQKANVVTHVTPTDALVSIIVPTREQPEAFQRCIESLFAHTGATPFELIVIDHINRSPVARTFLDGLEALAPDRIRVLAWDGDFNIATMNNLAATHARGTHLLFLNDDVTAQHEGWLDAMLRASAQPSVGIVGCRLDFPNGRLQHVGVVLGLFGTADFVWSGSDASIIEQHPELTVPRSVSAVTGACMLVERELFEHLGGFKPYYSLAYADFDLCLRARAAGFATVYTPEAHLVHDAGLTLKAQLQGELARDAQTAFDEQQARFLTTWWTTIAHDPNHHPALSLNSRYREIESVAAFAPDAINWHPLPNVLALPADHHGSGQYRVIQPATHAHAAGLARTRCADGYPLPIVFERLGIDTLYTQRQVDDAQLRALSKLKALIPLRIVIDFDDALAHVPDASIHKQSVWPDIERRLGEAARLADTLTVSTEPLAVEMRRHHADVRVVPNTIDPALWSPPPALARPDTPPTRLRVGWAGGLGHAPDLALLREVVSTLADEVDWVFFGMCLEDMRPHLTEFHRGVPFPQYPAKLAELGLDLALAPLAINRFNECKSNLRLLEYGALGIPVIATNFTPYQCKLPVTLIDNRPQSWIRTIRDRIGARDELLAEGQRLRNNIMTDWTPEKTLPKWIDAWTKPQMP